MRLIASPTNCRPNGDGWRKGVAEWVEGNTACVSVPFTWLLPVAYQRCVWLTSEGFSVRAGGPAVRLRPEQVGPFADMGDVDALWHHNPNATVTSRGCPNQCPFCAVPMTEGSFVELLRWEAKPVVCDNNLLACSRRHFDRVIDSLKAVPGVDFNQGLDARLLTAEHGDRLAELNMRAVRVAWDKTSEEPAVMSAIETLKRAGFRNEVIRVYILIGFEDTPDDAWYRLETLKAMHIWPNVMRYQPLTALRRNEYVAPGWTEQELRRFSRYWNKQRWLSKVPFEEYMR